MKYVIGIDLGTSSVKTILVDQKGVVCSESTKEYPLFTPSPGFSEQNPDDWVEKTIEALKEMTFTSNIDVKDIEGLSFSGQMHGLVLIDKDGVPLRNAILWNDTRTTKQCEKITKTLKDDLLGIAKNKALEGFTLPKILWVQENEPQIWNNCAMFLLPKDYLRYKLTGFFNMDYSDAAGTLLLDVTNKVWSEKICSAFSIPLSFCPKLLESHDYVGTITDEISKKTGLDKNTKVFTGGADNACGALGAGIVNNDVALCSIGTSGVLLSYEEVKTNDYKGDLHFFNHSKTDSFYIMGVTLAAGYSLSWFKDTFAKNIKFEELLKDIKNINIGCDGLIFTPYIMGERTPYADPNIRGSFIGISNTHSILHFTRSVLEGIVFSLKDSLEIMRLSGNKKINSIISIGGGAKNQDWLQMQADIFNTKIIKLTSEQGPALGASIIAAVGCGWYSDYDNCCKDFIGYEKQFLPIPENVEKYHKLYNIYKDVYSNTKDLSERLCDFR